MKAGSLTKLLHANGHPKPLAVNSRDQVMYRKSDSLAVYIVGKCKQIALKVVGPSLCYHKSETVTRKREGEPPFWGTFDGIFKIQILQSQKAFRLISLSQIRIVLSITLDSSNSHVPPTQQRLSCCSKSLYFQSLCAYESKSSFFRLICLCSPFNSAVTLLAFRLKATSFGNLNVTSIIFLFGATSLTSLILRSS